MPLPRTIGGYTPDESIYQDADIVLYRATPTGRAGCTVVLKTVAPGCAEPNEANNSLMKEADLLRQCNHPNIARLLEHFLHEGRPVLVIEHVDGATLGDLVRQGPLPPTMWLSIMVDLLRAVSHVHEQGILHLDIHLENVIVGTDRVARLIDFGAATGLGRDHTIRALNLRTSAPELHGVTIDRIGPSADIYSLGVVALVAALGEPAFREAVPHIYLAPESARQHRWYTLHADPAAALLPRLTAANAGPLGAIAGLIADMVATDPDTRPGPADHVADRLIAGLLGAEARGFSVTPTPRRTGRGVLIAALSLILVAGGVVVGLDAPSAATHGVCMAPADIGERIAAARLTPVEDFAPLRGVLEELLTSGCRAEARKEMDAWHRRLEERDDLDPEIHAELQRWARLVQAHIQGM